MVNWAIYPWVKENEKRILESCPHIMEFFNPRYDKTTFLENLALFQGQLISSGINENIINFMRFSTDPRMSRISPQNWKLYWESVGYTSGSAVKWHQERELRVFKTPGIRDDVVNAVFQGYKELLEELRIDVNIVLFGEHESINE